MTTTAGGDRVAEAPATARASTRVLWNALLIAAAAAVAIGLGDAFMLVISGEHQVVDFRPYYIAAEALLRGDTLYPVVDDMTLGSGRAYVYPPLTGACPERCGF